MPTSDFAETSEWNPRSKAGKAKAAGHWQATQIDLMSGPTPPDSDFQLAQDHCVTESGSIRAKTGQIIRLSLNGHPVEYRLTSLLGIGGMGKVYEAVVHRIGKSTGGSTTDGDADHDDEFPELAIKFAKHSNPERGQGLDREARILSRLNHPHVVRILGYGKLDDGEPFIVMPKVQGWGIVEHAERNQYSLAQKVAIFTKACDAVAHCHDQGILHRDIKPTNILVETKTSSPVLIDFGIAKYLTDSTRAVGTASEPQLSPEKTDGQLVGTIQYMSPEQALSQQQSLDQRSDIYSLGALLYELITGYPLVSSADLDRHSLEALFSQLAISRRPVLSQILSEREGTSGNRLVECLELIVEKAIRLDPGARYESVEEMKLDLESALRAPEQWMEQQRPTVRLPSQETSPVRRRRNPQSLRAKVTGHFWQALSVGLLIALIYALRAVNATAEMPGSAARQDDPRSGLPAQLESWICQTTESPVDAQTVERQRMELPDEAQSVDVQTPCQIRDAARNASVIVLRKQPGQPDSPIAPQPVAMAPAAPTPAPPAWIGAKTKLSWMTQPLPETCLDQARYLPGVAQKEAIVRFESVVRQLDSQKLYKVNGMIPRIPQRILYRCLGSDEKSFSIDCDDVEICLENF